MLSILKRSLPFAVAAAVAVAPFTRAFAQEGEPRPGDPTPAPTPAPAPDQPKPKADGEKPAPEPRRGGREGRGGRGPGGMGRMGIDPQELKEKLALSDKQLEQVTAIADEMRNSFRERMQKLMGEGLDREAMRAEMTKMRDEVVSKVEAVLDDAQKTKFRELVKENEQRFQRFGQGGPGGGSPEERNRRLLDEAKKALVLTPEEQTVVFPMVEKLLTSRVERNRSIDQLRQQFLGEAKALTDAKALGDRLAKFRADRDAQNEKLKAEQEQLRSVLTVEQEARLVALGILE